MACKFLDDVKAEGISILFGFNSSATVQLDTVDEDGKIKPVPIGYDLPFILHNSCRYSHVEVEYGTKMFGKIGK